MAHVFFIKAFTHDPQLGNPAGVVLETLDVPLEHMQILAQMVNFSETAFVFASQLANYKVRFFTPSQEVGLCGHAILATCHTLIEQKIITPTIFPHYITLETSAGIIPVTCFDDGHYMMTQKPPQFFEEDSDRSAIAQLLGLTEQDFLDLPIQTVSTGTPKLIIPLKSREKLYAIRPDFEGIAHYCSTRDTRGFYPFTTDTINPDSSFHARQFNPLAGIDEDPITGVAGGALACYAQHYNLLKSPISSVEQGYCMDKGGIMTIDLTRGVQVGGYAVTFGQSEIGV